jgi:hypothetical protein
MGEVVQPDEIKEILGYIDSIKKYDLQNYFQIQRILALIWGSLIIYAGIMDFVINSVENPTTAAPWLLANIIGVALSLYLNKISGDLAETEEMKTTYDYTLRANKFSTALLILWWIIIIVGVFLFQLVHLIMIFIGFALGIQMYITGWKEYGPGVSRCHIYKLNITNPGRFIGGIAIITSLVNILGVITFGEPYYVFSSLTFGIFIGSAFILIGLVSWE